MQQFLRRCRQSIGHHTRLAALAMSALFIGFFGVASGGLLEGNVLPLPGQEFTQSAGVAAVDTLDTAGQALTISNEELLQQLTTENGFVWQLIRIAKYILGAVFMVFLGIYSLGLVTGQGDESITTEYKRALAYSFIGFLLIMLAEPLSAAFRTMGVDETENVQNFLRSPATLQATVTQIGYSLRGAAKFLQYIVGGAALAFSSIALFRVVSGGGDDDELKNAKNTLLWSVIGLVLAGSIPFFIDRVIAPATPIDQQGVVIAAISDPAVLQELLAIDADGYLAARIQAGDVTLSDLTPQQQNLAMLAMSRLASRGAILLYVKYFQTFVAAAAVLMLFVAGARMTLLADNDDEVGKQKSMIVWVFIGMGLILFSEVIVNILFPTSNGLVHVPGLGEMMSFATQLGGITNFLLSFSGVVSLLSLIVGALYLSTAGVNPDQEEKAKKILLGAGLGIIVTVAAFALVNTVFSGTPSGDVTSVSIGGVTYKQTK